MLPTIVVSGPTASGKSNLALEIAKHFECVIINADSRQIYSEFPIATAQPTPESISPQGVWKVQNIDHYMYGFKSIIDGYDIHQYNYDLKQVLGNIGNRNNILTGGTGLYIDSYIYNYNLSQKNIQESYRKELQSLSKDSLKQILGNRIQTLNNSDRENPVRLIREIERGEITTLERRGDMRDCIYLYLDIDTSILESNIESRIETMLEAGLEKEALNYFKMKTENELPKIIGLEEFDGYFKRQISIEEVKKLIYLHTRQYAKRQRTWFARNKEIVKVKGLQDAVREIEIRIGRSF